MKNNKISNIRRSSLLLSGLLIVCSLFGIWLKGLNLGIDFTGGYLFEFATDQSQTSQQLDRVLSDRIVEKYSLNESQKGTYWFLRIAPSANSSTQIQFEDLQAAWQAQGIATYLMDSDFLDSQMGSLLFNQGGMALLAVFLLVLFYLVFRFEWRFAVGAIVALVHDLIVVAGFFAWLQVEFDLTVLASMLAILGYSLNDSIIVADKVREIMKIGHYNDMAQIIDHAVQTTMKRTLMTSGTTLVTVLSILLLAGEPLFAFSLALLFGIVFGTFSSIGIAVTLPQYLGLKAQFFTDKQAEFEALAKMP